MADLVFILEFVFVLLPVSVLLHISGSALLQQ